jgi:hypothetical protein
MYGPAVTDDAGHQADRDGVRGELDEPPGSAGGGTEPGSEGRCTMPPSRWSATI